MAGRGPAPKDASERLGRSGAPKRGEMTPAPGVGWQHGDMPAPPDGLMPASLEAWRTWFAGWWAAHWTLEDVPGLRQCVRLYDAVERGELQRHSEMRLMMDTYGITPKGQQDRRWKPPVDEDAKPQRRGKGSSQYGHLRPA